MSYNELVREFEKGIFLKKFGINNYGFSRSQVLSVIDSAVNNGVAILGGDVFSFKNNIISSTNDNWFIDREKNEPELQYLARTKQLSFDFVSSYRTGGQEILFALTFENTLPEPVIEVTGN